MKVVRFLSYMLQDVATPWEMSLPAAGAANTINRTLKGECRCVFSDLSGI